MLGFSMKMLIYGNILCFTAGPFLFNTIHFPLLRQQRRLASFSFVNINSKYKIEKSTFGMKVPIALTSAPPESLPTLNYYCMTSGQTKNMSNGIIYKIILKGFVFCLKKDYKYFPLCQKVLLRPKTKKGTDEKHEKMFCIFSL